MKRQRFILVLIAILLLTSALMAQGALTQATPVCPLGQGYWANHPESWPATTATVMLGAQSYTQAELQALIPGGGGSASTILAVQLIAAKLNLAAGADTTPINGLIVTADSLLAQFEGKLPYNVDPSSTDGQTMVALASTLDAYNSGQLTPNCVVTPEVTESPTPTPNPAAVVVVIQGPVQVINVNIITVAGINIQVSADNPILPTLMVGMPIHVEGTVGTDAVGVVLINATVLTVVPDVTAATIFIRGTVQAINVNIITIAGISIQVDPANPTLPAVQVGDFVEINANLNFDGVTVIVVATTVTIVINTVPEGTPEATPPVDGTPEVTATPTPGLPITIIVEGPVQVINVNVITIYDIDITINADDPVLTNIQVGDFVRIEGDAFEDLDVLVVVAVTVFVVDVDVIWTNNNVIVWQDDGDCGNGPPPWAPAWGWRARCQNPIIIIVGGRGMGMGDDD